MTACGCTLVYMADNDDVSDGPDGDPVAPPEAPGPVLKTRWRDRAWSFRAMIAVALATLLIGGLAGGTVVAMADDDHDGRRIHRMGPWGPGAQLPPGWRHRHFNDGSPQWRWNDGPQPPDDMLTPSPRPEPPSASPSP